MSYSAEETSSETGRPVELYLFEQKEGSAFTAYTSGNAPVVYDGKTYAPQTISRSNLKLSTKTDSGALTITVPSDCGFVARYKKGQPPLPDQLTIYRTHLEDASSEVFEYWKGSVIGVTFSKHEAKIGTSTIYSHLSRSVPKRTFSFACNHILYDSGCQVGAESHRSDARVASITDGGTTLGLSEDADWTGTSLGGNLTSDSTYFNGGYCEAEVVGGTQRRMLLTVRTTSGLECVLNTPFDDLLLGTSIKFYAGCNHSVSTCKTKFDNVRNYGGCPFVPTRNPFSTGVVNTPNYTPFSGPTAE